VSPSDSAPAPDIPRTPATDSAGEPALGAAGRPEPARAPTVTGDEARNVVMVQTSASTWDVRVSGSDEVVGTITKTDDDYRATDARGDDLGFFASPELAMFGVVTRA
jgi:hypothetical protein